MPETTQIGEQMQTLGFSLGADMRLKTIAWDVAKHGGDAADLLQALQEDPEAALAMFTLGEMSHRAKLVLDQSLTEQQRHARKRGVPVEFPRKRDGGGQSRRDTQCGDAPADQQDSAGNGAASGDGGQRPRDTQTVAAATPDDDEQDAAGNGGGRGGQGGPDTQARVAPTVTDAPSDDDGAGGGHGLSDTQSDCAPAAPAKPHGHGPQSASRRAAAITARNKSAQSVLARGSLVSGKPYGDLTKADLRQEVHRADHRGQFARRVLAEAKFWDEDTTPLKRVMAEKQAKSLWDKAWEAVNHAA